MNTQPPEIPSATPAEDPLMIRADTLVQAASFAAPTAYASAEAKYPFLKTVVTKPEDKKWWDIVFTIAAVYIAATRLHDLELDAGHAARIMAKVSERLVGLNPNALEAFDDCKEFFSATFEALTESGHEPRFIASDAIGLWIGWNLLDRRPESDEEWAFARGVGVVVTHSFFHWWDEKP